MEHRTQGALTNPARDKISLLELDTFQNIYEYHRFTEHSLIRVNRELNCQCWKKPIGTRLTA